MSTDWKGTAQVGGDGDPVTWGQLWGVAELFYDRFTQAGFASAAFRLQSETPKDDEEPVSRAEVEQLLAFDFSPPAAPADVAATVSDDGSVMLSWKDPSTNTAAFYVERSDDKGKTWIALGQAPSATPAYIVPADKAGAFGFTQFRVVPATPPGVACRAGARRRQARMPSSQSSLFPPSNTP